MADTLHSVTAASPQDAVSPSDRNKDIRKSLTFSGGHHIGRTGENVGVVKARPLLEARFEPESFFQACLYQEAQRRNQQHTNSLFVILFLFKLKVVKCH